MPEGDGGTAAEVILEVYRQRMKLAETGESPSRVVLSRALYDLIRDYHQSLGSLPPGTDYIDRYRLFDLEICIDSVDAPRVE